MGAETAGSFPNDAHRIACKTSFGSNLVISFRWSSERWPSLPCLLATPFRCPYFVFHGWEYWLCTRAIGKFRRWLIRAKLWQLSHARSRWRQERAVWKPMLAFLDSHEICADLNVCSDSASLIWPSQRVARNGFLNYDSDPPSQTIQREFEQFLRQLHHVWHNEASVK